MSSSSVLRACGRVIAALDVSAALRTVDADELAAAAAERAGVGLAVSSAEDMMPPPVGDACGGTAAPAGVECSDMVLSVM